MKSNGSSQVFVTKKVTNGMIYEMLQCMDKKLGNMRWQIRFQWGCIGLLGAGMVLIIKSMIGG